MSFPANPSVGQQATEFGRLYQWTGSAWDLVASVAGHAATHAAGGNDPLSPSAIGAAPAAHTHDDRYYTETEVDTLLAGKQAAGTYATLVNGTVPASQLPSYVQSVAGRTGAVTLAKADVGLSDVDNTSDANKPISTATQTALDLKAPLASPAFTGVVSIPAGSVTEPSLTFTGDTDTGIYRPGGGNQLAVTLGGVERLRVAPWAVTVLDADGTERHKLLAEDGYYYATGVIRSQIFLKGNYALGATDVGVLHFMNAADAVAGRFDCSSTTADATTRGVFRWQTNDGTGTNVTRALLDENGLELGDGSASLPSLSNIGDTNTGIWFPATDTWAVSTGGVERLRVDSVGRILVGATVSRTGGPANHPALQIEGLTAGTSALQCIAGSATANVSPQVVIARHRGTAVGESTAVVDSDSLGMIRFSGADGTDVNNSAAFVECLVDGAPATNSIPGRIVFATTTVGGTQSLERMRITSSGNVGIGTSSPTARLHVSGDTIVTGSLTIGSTTATATGVALLGSADAAAARATLGAAASSHSHAASDITSGTLDIARIPTGSTASTVCVGNDSRLSDTRTPTDGTVTTAKIADSAVTYAKMQSVASTDRLLGRSSAGAGIVEEIVCTAAGRALLDDVDAAAQRTTLGAAASTHTHSAADITSGTVATARLGSGAASSATFLRGDQQWADANGVRAWVNFNGTTSPLTIRASLNVSSLTDNGTGKYTINLTSGTFADASYAALLTSSLARAQVDGTSPPTQTACSLETRNASNTLTDAEHVMAAFFR